MNINVRGKNIEVTPALKEYAERRIGKLEKFLGEDFEAVVALSVTKEEQTVEVTIPFNGMIIRGEESTADMYSSIDLVIDKLEKQVEKYKGKIMERRVRATGGKPVSKKPSTKEKAKENGPRVVKTKRFAVKPMDVDEAILQMNLLGHSFFVFFNAENEQVNVLYRRKDGNYGLIEQEFE